MKRYFTSAILIFFVVCFVCWAYISIQDDIKHRPLKNPDGLRTAIFESIVNPFPQADTLVLNTSWFICGNSRPDELPDIFETYIDSSYYKNKLAGKLHITVLTSKEFDNVMDTVLKYRFKGEYPTSLWDTCRKSKVAASIGAECLTATTVRLYESYSYNTKNKTIQKDFNFKNGNWVYSVDSIANTATK